MCPIGAICPWVECSLYSARVPPPASVLRRLETLLAAPEPSPEQIALAARTIRVLTLDAVREAGIGHIGLPLGCAELATVLWSSVLRHDPQDPGWPDRDRFVLSAGHGSMLLYSLLHLSGYAVSERDIRGFRKLGSITPGHPEVGVTPGVETTTGPLGQGVGNAVGMAKEVTALKTIPISFTTVFGLEIP